VAGVSLALKFQEILSPSQPYCVVTDKRVVSFGRNPSPLLLSSTQFYHLIDVYPSLFGRVKTVALRDKPSV